MIEFFSKQYGKVEQLDESSDDANNPLWMDTVKGKARSFRAAYLPWLLHLVVIAAYSIFIFVNQPKIHKCSPCFSGKDHTKPPSGTYCLGRPTFYTNAYTNHTDPYSRQNPDVDSTWADPIEDIIIVITEEEKRNLPGGRDTARAYGEQDGYAVSIAMFHQLHCLNHLRKSYFSDKYSEIGDPDNHSDHCFSYLYQTLLCFADVGVTTLKWLETNNMFQPEWNLTKQCRNNNLIKNWQGSRKAQFLSESPRYDWP